MTGKLIVGFVCAAVLSVWTTMASAEDAIIGIWLTEEHDSKIEFSHCGEALCGRIVWLLKPNDEEGQPYRDIRNPSPDLRDQTILGLTIFPGLTAAQEANRWRGRVYNPEDGDTYQTVVSLLPNGTLEVKGCVLGGLICDSSYWTRSDD